MGSFGKEYDELYKSNLYTNELIPVMSVSGPVDILTYDSLRDPTLYIAPTFYKRRIKVPVNSNVFPEHYRSPTFFPYFKRI